MIQVAVPKEHPYQSHISRYAIFPSFRSLDDSDIGVRDAFKQPLNPFLPSSAPAVTVLHKTKGSPCRHEILDVPMETRRKAMIWPGQHGFQNHTKALKEEAQVFYPSSPKTVCPNASLHDWSSTLSKRTANVLHNLEKVRWLTSYQLNYTGTGPTNPIKLDDFVEKTIAMITRGTNPFMAQLRERSVPTFILSRPLEGRNARGLQNQQPLSTSVSLGTSDLGLTLPHTLNSLVLEQDTTVQTSAQGKEHVQHSLESEAGTTEQNPESNQSFEDKNQDPGFKNMPSLISKRALSTNYRSVDAKSKDIVKSTNREIHKEEKLQTMKAQSETGNEYFPKHRAMVYTAGKNVFEPDQTAKDQILLTQATEKEMVHFRGKSEETDIVKTIRSSLPSIQPRSFNTPRKKSLDKGTCPQPQSTLLELQDSFSKSEAHRRFQQSFKGTVVDLRDNHNTGRKHTFYGFNSYYFHD